MMLQSEIHGRHLLGNGEGILLQDLYEFLKRMPRKARGNYLTVDGKDVLGISFGQSDQAEKWEFKVSLVLDEEK